MKKFEVAGYDMPCVDLAVNVDVFPKPNGGTGIKYTRAGQRRVFAERKTGSVVGCDAGCAQYSGDAACKGGHAGLGVLGFVQYTRCIGKADLL